MHTPETMSPAGHKSSALYGVFRDGLEPRGGQMITISTAGDDEESPLGLMREKAYQLSLRREGAYRFASSPDGGYALHEWALEPDQDLENLELVRRPTPPLGRP